MLLELRGIGKSFPGTRALDGVNLSVNAGEVVALLGENGAGKSTLMKILSGVWPHGSFEGEVRVASASKEPLTVRKFRDTRDAHNAGIAMIHQELSVFPELSVAEHLELDLLPPWIDWKQLYARAQVFLDGLELGLQAETRVGDLSVGGRQLVEIARALYRKANVLVFDEPTSALTDAEVERLYRIVERLRTDGKGIIYITHRLDEVFRLANRMVVLRDGKNAGESNASARAQLEPQIISWMVGRPIHAIYPPRATPTQEEALRVEKLSLRSPGGKTVLRDVSFRVNRGEVLGLGGLLGSGRSEVFEALFGALHSQGPKGRPQGNKGWKTSPVSGAAWIKGRRYMPEMPAHAIASKIAFVSEDRKGNGLILNQSIRKNMTLPSLVASTGEMARPWVPESKEKSATQKWMSELRIKASSAEQAVDELSGGNQQKVVLAKWLMTQPEILFLDEPTRGVDVGAKVEIYQWIQKLASQGMAIVVASSEMPELLGISHRVIVLREGQVSGEFMASTATQEDIMRAASL